jgi:prophage regulatory protein
MAEIIERFVRLPEVRRITGMSTTTIYRWMKNGRFPHSVPITPGTVVWREADIARWQKGHFPQSGSG